MNKRVSEILSQVRLNLKSVSTDALQNKQIYNKANRVQNDIMRETKCTEKSFDVILKSGQESYDFLTENIFAIKNYLLSWDGELTHKINYQWNSISKTGENRPLFYTVFADKIYFRPIPLNTGDVITFWCYQRSNMIKIDDEIPPEIPEYADTCLILGICAEYDLNFLQRYQYEKEKIGVDTHIKVLDTLEGEVNW